MTLSTFRQTLLPASVLLATLGWTPAFSDTDIAAEQRAFQPVTKGGVTAGAQIVVVTNLNSEGEGSLAAALQVPGPKIVTFDVGGVIEIDWNMSIETPFTTIAGETAPSPGITINGAGLRIRSHDVVVRHIAIRARPTSDPEFNESLDTLSIGGNPQRYGGPIRNVLIENVSVSWGVDENLSVWDEHTGNVQIRSTIIAEALNDAGHPEGTHSKGLLVGSGIDKVSVTDSLFAHNVDRQPRVSPDAQVNVERNVVYNPVQVGIEIFVDCDAVEPPRRIANSVLIPGPSTYDEVALYNFNNYDYDIDEYGDPDCKRGWDSLDFVEADEATERAVTRSVMAHVGARPKDRNATDQRVLREVETRTGQIRDTPTRERTAGNGRSYFSMPADPFAVGADGRLAIEVALCEAHLALGGLPSRSCR